jgi:hypothetical protein
MVRPIKGRPSRRILGIQEREVKPGAVVAGSGQFELLQELSFRSAALSREESAVLAQKRIPHR